MDDHTITGTPDETGNVSLNGKDNLYDRGDSTGSDHANGRLDQNRITVHLANAPSPSRNETLGAIASSPLPDHHGTTGETEPAVLSPMADPIPAFERGYLPNDLRATMTSAVEAWLGRTPSYHTRDAYRRNLDQFLEHAGIAPGAFEQLTRIRPQDVERVAGRTQNIRPDQ